jgi:hypothetical protein
MIAVFFALIATSVALAGEGDRPKYRLASSIGELVGNMDPATARVFSRMYAKGCLSLTEKTADDWQVRQCRWKYIGKEPDGRHRVVEIKPPYRFWVNPEKYRRYR